MQCEIECCTGDKCNKRAVPTLPTPGSGTKETCDGEILLILGL